MKIFSKFKLIIFLNCCLLFYYPILAKAAFIDLSDPPPGFEVANIKQHLRVTVLFMQQNIGSFYIDLHQGQLKFHSPELLLPQLNNIKKKKQVLSLLNQSFPLNMECYANGMAALPNSCKQLKNKSMYVIYNQKQETVYLYLARSYFTNLQTDDAIEFIPNSSSGWSYLNKLGAMGSFSNDPLSSSQIYSTTPKYYNFYSSNTLAYGNSSVVGNLSQNQGIDNGEHFQIQNLYAQYIAQDKIYTGGYIVNSSSPFFQTQTIIGAGLKTTLETVKNPENIMAVPLVIFVPQASQVSIFRNEQLIFSQYLEAGYQRINTTGFPEGGYELTVKIGSNTIRQFFSKGLALPPEHAPQFYVMGGYLTNGLILNDDGYNFLPHVLNIPVLQAGINKRMSERIALQTDVLLNSHQGLIDFGPAFFSGNFFVKTAALITTKNNYGFYTMLNAQKNNFNVNVLVTKIFYRKKKPDYFFLNNLIDNDSISASYQLSEHDLLGIQANYNKSLYQPNTYNGGVFYQREIIAYQGARFFLNAAYNKASYAGDTYSVSLTVNFGHGQLAGTESLSWQGQTKKAYQDQFALPVVVQGSTVYSHQNEQGIGYSLNEIHTISPSASSLAGTYDYTADEGYVTAYANYNRAKGEKHSHGYGGNLETELAVTPGSVRLNGIDRGNMSGIIAGVKSNDAANSSAKFALLDANNRKIAVLPANKKIFVSLPGFTDQNYSLVNLSKSDYFIKDPVRHITLYPGNIGCYSWTVEKRVIVIGRVINHSGRPIANTWIHTGKNGIFTDNVGNFQLELAQNTAMLTAGNFCKINLPRLNVNKAYVYIGETFCS